MKSVPLFRFTEQAGPHAVGLKIVEQYDYSRTFRHGTDELGKPFAGERARPLQTLIWYPAESSGNKPMSVDDYGSLWATETRFGNPQLPPIALETLAAMKPTLAMSMWAMRDAAPSRGRFPLIVYAPSFFSVSWENADLCEYLASHGYVVVSSPCMGAATRTMTLDLRGIETQARDIAFLIGYAQTLQNTDMSRIAVAGFSWGGISNLFAAARDDRIGALIALDGSLRFSPGLVRQAGDVHPQQMTIPLLSFAQRYWSFEESDRYLTDAEKDGPNVLNLWVNGDLINVHMLGLCHAEFSSMFQRSEDMWWKAFNLSPLVKADYTREDGITGYAWMARYTLQFLNAYLKNDAEALAFLQRSPAENGVPAHVMAASFRAAKGVPTSFDDFRTQIGRQGFDRIADIYTSFRQQDSAFTLTNDELQDWSDDLIKSNHLADAIHLLGLNVQIHPTSSSAYMKLGDAYRKLGQAELAMDSYKKALERDAIKVNVMKKIRDAELNLPPAVAPHPEAK